MNEEGFRKWLGSHGYAENTIGNDIARMRRLEASLEEYGLPDRDLDAAYDRDEMEGVLAALRQSLADLPGKIPPLSLVPRSEDYAARLKAAVTCAEGYRNFSKSLQFSPHKTEVDRIAAHARDHYIAPARARGDPSVDIVVSDVNRELDLGQGWPHICQALRGARLQELAQVAVPQRIGANDRPSTTFRFELTDHPMTDNDLLACFDRASQNFSETRSQWTPEAVAVFCRIARLIHEIGLDWYAVSMPTGPVRFGRKQLKSVVAYTCLGGLKYHSATREYVIWTQGPFGEHNFTLDDSGFQRLESVVADRLDQIAAHNPNRPNRPGHWPDAYPSAEQASTDAPGDVGATNGLRPRAKNLILYGPPGTGKTFHTAREAVRLCTGQDIDDRATLMKTYTELQNRGRIGFVTFHQSYSYEEFVEGLRPPTGDDVEEGGRTGGFSLKPRDGIFKQIAKLASENHGRAIAAAGAAPIIDQHQKIFKMSLGRTWAPEDDAIFQNAMNEGYVVLGYGGEIDWSGPQFDTWDGIKDRWREDHPGARGTDPNMAQMYAFRINMEIGSLVVISDGNLKFRAIGRIVGPYQFVPGTNGEYNHRRKVQWLWRGQESLSHDRIYGKGFSMVSVYQLNSRVIKWDALEQIVASGGEATATTGDPEPYVLIIDEINRANISKVFGELITLIEPDKRTGFGQENALTVKLPYSGDEFGVPTNLHIIGTMNTADRSIALLDTALRRRFDFREIMPDIECLTEAGNRSGIGLPRLLSRLNEGVEFYYDREHQIGHAYFIHCQTDKEVDAVMRHKVIPLLAEYFFEDWSKVAAVLGDLDEGSGDFEGGFLVRKRLSAPFTRSDDQDQVRYRWSVRSPDRGFDYGRLLGE